MNLLDRLFKPRPKWQHSEPEIRKQALQELNPGDPVLQQIVQDDEADAELRRLALAKINDLALLAEVAAADSEPEVTASAQTRIRELLSGKETDSPDLETRLKWLQQSPDVVDLSRHIAINAKDVEMRQAALQHITDQSICCHIAINDPVLELRTQALAKVTEHEQLQQIVKSTRKRDKRIYKLASQRLSSAQEKNLQQTAVARLCHEMESLTWDGATGSSAAEFVRIANEWQQFVAAADEQSKQRFQQAYQRFDGLLQASAVKRSRRLELCRQLQELLQQLGERFDLDSDDQSVQSAIEQARQAWSALGDLDSTDLEGQRLQREFNTLQQRLTDRERELRRQYRQLDKRRAVLQTLSDLVARSGLVLEADVSDIKKRWQRLPVPDNPGLLRQLQDEFNVRLAEVDARLQRQTEQKGLERQAINAIVDQLEKALGEGELQRAISLEQEAKTRLENNISLSRHQITTIRQRLQEASGAISKLRGWRRWGTNRAREDLIEQAERLVGDDTPKPPELARHIRELRAAWKTLDSTEGAAAQSLWHRFNTVCERAYEPCQQYFAEQAGQRQQNLAQRESVCEQLEALLRDNDWEGDNIDWRAVSKAEQDCLRKWRSMGPVDRKDRKRIDERFQTALEQLQCYLKPRLDEDLQRRQQLIRQVQDLLTQEADINAAIAATKAAQAAWQPRILASRRREQALWKTFRAACDAIFERRQAARDAQDAEQLENLNAKIALCERLEAAAALPAESIMAARAEVQAVQTEWQTIGFIPKPKIKMMERRFEQALGDFDRACQRQQRAAARAELSAAAERARLCSELESWLEKTPRVETRTIETAIAGVQERWQVLASVKPALETRLQQRFEQLRDALLGEDESLRELLIQQLKDNQPHKRELCLRLEIAVGADTPAEYREERMSYQVARLSESMVNRTAQPQTQKLQQEVSAIEQEWVLTGSLPHSDDLALQTRFDNALQQFFDRQNAKPLVEHPA